jgi:NNP family nitrate/nitrite transporter-like MFS transporter
MVVVPMQPPPELAAGSSLVAIAFAPGLGTGGVFAWVAQGSPAERVGSVTGIVGAAGGLGGYFPPLVRGLTYNAAARSYTIGLVLLSVTHRCGVGVHPGLEPQDC